MYYRKYVSAGFFDGEKSFGEMIKSNSGKTKTSDKQ